MIVLGSLHAEMSALLEDRSAPLFNRTTDMLALDHLDIASLIELLQAYKIAPRRPGDAAQCYAVPTLAHPLLGWRARHTLSGICADAWRWQSANPDAYV